MGETLNLHAIERARLLGANTVDLTSWSFIGGRQPPVPALLSSPGTPTSAHWFDL